MKDFDTFGTLKWLAEVKGVSGNEQGAGSAAEVALELLREYIPDAGLDCHGSVVGFIGERENDKPTIMLDAHIDQIGLIVTHIDSKGFIKVEPCGGIDRRTLAAQAVTIHSTRSKSPIKATVCTLPPHVKKNDGEVLKADSIMLDAGMTAEQSKELISLGDVVTIDGEPILLQGKIVTAGALDDRAGVCSILYALHLLKESDLEYNIAVSFSVQEELGCRGATVTAYNAEPEFAVVVDVSYGLSPGCFEPKTAYKCGVLGKGPMI
ncbi:MAG: M28 family peptidase, partial [Oscillospiraceae bacterium]|nr:M28 family peptidase [Oscillospiraceae bacterium]